MDVNKHEYVFFDIDKKDKNAILEEIAKRAHKLKLTTDYQDLYKAFLAREKESSTGFEDGFAIPHARTNTITKPALLFVNLSQAVNWNSIDGKPTKYLFCILVPSNNKNNAHIEILSKISTMLMDKEFVKKIKSCKSPHSVSDLINKTIKLKIENDKTDSIDLKSNKKSIIALTACPVGVAHTYLAAEKLVETGKRMGINIKAETHGSAGIKNKATDEEIEKADVILVAADIGLDLSRFAGKKVYKSSIKPAIHEPQNLITKALNEAQVYNEKSNTSTSSSSTEKTGVMKHILAGISYMVPFVILGGICIALALGIGKLIYGNENAAPKGDFLWYLEQIGSVAFTLMIGVLGAYIANSIAGRSAIAPAFVVSIVANTAGSLYPIGGIEVVTAMGFIGSILFGLLIGYTVKWVNTWNINKNLSSIMPIFIIPLGVGLFYSLIAIFVIGAPIGWLMDKFIAALKVALEGDSSLNIGVGIGFGLLFGAMAGFDMGGPINKVAFLTCSALISSKIYQPMGMMAAAIPVAPLGMGLCTVIFRNKFNEQEKTMGISALVMGMIGISEGAIPFAISDPKKAIASNVIGSAIAGAIAGAFGVTCYAAHGGPIVGILGAISSSSSMGLAWGIPWFFVAIIVGTLVTAFVYGIWRKVGETDASSNAGAKRVVIKGFSKKAKENNQVNKISKEQLKFNGIFA